MLENENDFTQGNIASKLIKFMIPILGALVLQAMYGAVAMLVLARPLALLMQAPEEALDSTVLYVRICGGYCPGGTVFKRLCTGGGCNGIPV